MEKTITLNGKETKLKANAMNALIYRAAFGEDIFKVQGMFAKIVDADGNVNIELIDSIGVMRLVWTMAKAADKETYDFEKWLEGFEEGFPVMDILTDIGELLTINLTSTTKIKNASAAGN